jgi:hypothetical protein
VPGGGPHVHGGGAVLELRIPEAELIDSVGLAALH